MGKKRLAIGAVVVLLVVGTVAVLLRFGEGPPKEIWVRGPAPYWDSSVRFVDITLFLDDPRDAPDGERIEELSASPQLFWPASDGRCFTLVRRSVGLPDRVLSYFGLRAKEECHSYLVSDEYVWAEGAQGWWRLDLARPPQGD